MAEEEQILQEPPQEEDMYISTPDGLRRVDNSSLLDLVIQAGVWVPAMKSWATSEASKHSAQKSSQ